MSFGVEQNKISINVAEGVQALTKTLRVATNKAENRQSANYGSWSLVQVHAAGALWNLSRFIAFLLYLQFSKVVVTL